MEKKIKVACLPVAGIENPYQHLMMKGLNESGKVEAFSGINDKFFGIIRTAIQQRPDYIHFDWIASFYYRKYYWLTILSLMLFWLQLIIVKGIFNIKLVWTLHNIIPHDARHLAIHRQAQRLLAKKASWIRVFSELSISKASHELMVEAEKFRVVPEGSYVDFYPNKISTIEGRQYFNIPPTAKVFLYLGLIKPYKGVYELVKYLAKKSDENLYLVVAGKSMDPSYLKSINEIKCRNLILVDEFIAADKLQYFYNACDAVILPFKNIENSGSVIMAMGFKKPVIAPKMGVLPERLICQPELLFEDSFEVAIEKVLQMPVEMRNNIGECNFKKLELYKWIDFSRLFSF